MPRLLHRNPKYRKHRASGQAIVTLSGQDFYLGPHGTKASRAEYDRVIAEWLANGRRPPAADNSDLHMLELVDAFWTHAQTYYSGHAHRGELGSYRLALQLVNRLYARTLIIDFGPKALKAVRQVMVQRGWVRRYVNRQVGRIRHVFKWGVENELVPVTVYQTLLAVAGLRQGKSEARESQPVRPAPEAHIAAVLPHVSRQVRAMIELQQLTGMRPGETCAMRGSDISTTDGLWLYKPAAHKTAHHGHERVIYLGPRAKAIIEPFLKPDLSACMFSPAEAMAELRQARHQARKTPLSCGNVPGSNCTRKPKRRPKDAYSPVSYARAITRACKKAGVPAWHPHQLRHSAATRLRKEYGLEAAQVILGHRTLAVTEIYAEKNVAAAMKIMSEVG